MSYSTIDSACVKDLVGGATNGNICVSTGHEVSYWEEARMINGVNERLGSEAFTEFNTGVLFNNGSIETIKKYFPKTYNVYIEMIQECV